jgi:trehalose 6-phosphate phosphatase
MTDILEWINRSLIQAKRLWLFLGYDGTLNNVSPESGRVCPNSEVVALLAGLVRHPRIRVAVISGQRLSHMEALVPVPGVLLAGTCGAELRTPEGEHVDLVAYDTIRQVLDALKPRWLQLIAPREGFSLEDKLWSLALDARFADDDEAEEVLARARRMAAEAVTEARGNLFRLLGGHKFLEIAPQLAHKGRAVEYVLDRYPWPRALPLYLGDGDKDEEAFGAIKARGGIAILVSRKPRETKADYRLAFPQAVLYWLATLPARFELQVPVTNNKVRGIPESNHSILRVG